IERPMREHGLAAAAEPTLSRRYSAACPAWPTCGLAVTESERALPGLLDEMEVELKKHGLGGERISVHMTGCPNGCARPYTPDIGFVGRAAGEKYTIYLGGNAQGTRLGYLFKDYVPKPEIIAVLSPVFARFKADRHAGESFGDFCARLGKVALGGDVDSAR
ncbi:MAG: NADPH-dependent assimilatory sulfite reductase hemoprotein subunit, partial [Planctomycetota bacterium]|nr:NADPH-dependent assimilatory sulfite reductase hemoprotein subunit [Planctomycetota bacterium]